MKLKLYIEDLSISLYRNTVFMVVGLAIWLLRGLKEAIDLEREIRKLAFMYVTANI